MAKANGPGGPKDPTLGGKVLELRAKIAAKDAQDVKDLKGLDLKGLDGPGDAKEINENKDIQVPEALADGFGFGSGGGTGTFENPFEGDRGANVKTRLAALSARKGGPLIKSNRSDQPRTIHTPLGKVLEGVVHADTAAGLQRLDGVVRAHEIGLQESRIKSADLLVLKSLLEVGRFTIEGSPTLQTTDALSALELAGSVYIGFNGALSRVVLNLKQVDVLIIEGNDSLREIHLPRLEFVTRYLHIHDNPQLVKVTIGSPDKRADIAELELVGNGQKSYPGIYSK